MPNNKNDQWTVRNIIELQKSHERVLRATASLRKAVVELELLSNKYGGKPNGEMFVKDSAKMMKAFTSAVMPDSKFWNTWESFKDGGEAAFPNDWITKRI